MSNIFSVSCILSVDHKKKENLIVSAQKDDIILPVFQIQYPKLLWNELRYQISELFFDNNYNKELIKNITFSYTGIQNELVIKYIQSLNNPNYDIENDLFILSCVILEEPYDIKNLHWNRFKFVKSLQDMTILNSIIDFVIQQGVL